MKKVIILLFALQISVFSQNTEKVIKALDDYADSVNNLISISSGAPGEIYSNSVNTVRNVRAIGVQETKVTYYYFQKDDSVYEIDGAVNFLPRYNLPLKIKIEYNIATSQNVFVSYYTDGENLLYLFRSAGSYGYMYRTYWFSKNELLRYDEKNSDKENNSKSETGKFSKEVYNDGLIVLENAKDYLKLYNDINKIEQKDK